MLSCEIYADEICVCFQPGRFDISYHHPSRPERWSVTSGSVEIVPEQSGGKRSRKLRESSGDHD